ncbi:hypothetical protein L6164_034973 [Bauhinia variegata]|uniref:Uncharacterized protein n=1 Tax=Bauhinia variegata TaxID=167791 RepID=A0ACB9KX46_BAUVA|nr:hypothetical protein L6164_034973 [Bauhinia variegata]
MALKRKTDNEGYDRKLDIQSKRRHEDSERMMLIRNIGNFRIFVPFSEIASRIGDLVRTAVGQELPRQLSGLQICRSPSVHHVGASGAKPILELRFANKVASTIYSNSKITPIQIELVDIRTEGIIREGPLSSVKIKICVLDGVFGKEDWTADQFDANILRSKDGKEPLLKGQTLIKLQNGVATIANHELTDNSHCTKSGSFRLGAKVAESSPIEELNIREGISEPFKVKDGRGKEYEKHHPPSLSDNICRLEGISKNGKIRKQLCSDGIKTVKDLLRRYTTNPSSLEQKFGRYWGKIIKHAEECDMNEYDYSEYSYPTNQQEGKIRLLFDPIYKLVGVSLNGHNYCRPHTLTAAADKKMVERAKQHAYKNLKDLIPINEATTTSLLAQLDASPNQSNLAPDFPTAQQGSTRHLCEAVHDPMPQSSTDAAAAGGNQQGFLYHLQFSPDPAYLLPDGNPSVFQLPVATPQDSSTTLLQRGTIPSYINPNFAMYTSKGGTRKSMWYRILAAFKCFV